MKKRFKEVPQCSDVAFGKAQAVKNSEVIYQTLSLKGGQLEMFVEINSSGKVGKVKFLGIKGAKNDPELRLMMCSTYAVMRTLQPDLESSDVALKNPPVRGPCQSKSHLKWPSISTKSKPSTCPLR